LQAGFAQGENVISLSSGGSLLNYLNAQNADASGAGSSSASSSTAGNAASSSAAVAAKVAATSQAALQAAAGRHSASVAAHTLDTRQASLGTDLHAALAKSGVKLSGTVEFSVSSDGAVAVNGSDADVAATKAFLKADTSTPNFATRIATQAKDALKLSATIQQSAAISQAARYGGKSGGVMAMYTSLMQHQGTGAAVFTLSAASSSLTYPGTLTAKA
jgi:hypothetical protein